MAIPTYLVGANGMPVKVNANGEVLVSDGPYDLSVFNELAVANTAYNFFQPKGREQFVITGFLMYGDKEISGVSNATVVIYESDAPDSTIATKVLLQVEVGQNQPLPFPNIRVLCSKGVYINAKTDDDDVHMTLFGHYINNVTPINS